MDESSTPEVVTENEAIDKVKKWIEELDWEKAKEGCMEILEIDPNNETVKALLAQAEKGIAERPTEAVAPVETVVKAAGAIEESSMERAPASEASQATPPGAKNEVSSLERAPASEAKPEPATEPAPLPQRKNKSTVIIAFIVGFLILVLLILALVFGWLNPVFDWIFGLIG
ncbi:hypothetical protein ACFL3T_04685 [Patescibacteria group bacterium]